MKCCLYLRVSKEEQAKEGVSLEAQESRLKDYCKAREWNIIQIYRDEGFSAFKEKETRPSYERLKEDCKKNLFDIILVTKLDRIFRNFMEAVSTLNEWEKLNKKFVSMTESFDTSTHMGRAFLRLALIFAELESGNISDRVKFVHQDRINKGIHIHRPPFGYYLKNKKWIIDKTKADIVKYIFQRVADGENAKYVATDYELKLQRIYYILKNRAYLGEVFFNKQWIKGNHLALIDSSLFDAANSRIKKIVLPI